MELLFTDHDFARLINSSTRWKDGVSEFAGQFENYTNAGMPYNAPISTDWLYAYWLGEEYVSVVFAKSFLTSIGEGYEALWDTSTEFHGWVIVTNYAAREYYVN